MAPTITLLFAPSSPTDVGKNVAVHAVVTDIPPADLEADKVLFIRTAGDAVFVDGIGTSTTYSASILKSAAVWQADALLTSEAGGISTIYAQLELQSGELIYTSAVYTFKGKPPTFEKPSVWENFADGESPIVISGRILDNYDYPIPKIDVDLKITHGADKTAWVLPEKPGAVVTVTTDDDGKYTAELVTTALDVKVALSLTYEPDAQPEKLPITPAPKPRLTLQLIGDNAAADGHQAIKAIATMVEDSNPTKGMQGYELDFTLVGSAVFDPDSKTPQQVTGETDSDGNVAVLFTCEKIESGTIKVAPRQAPEKITQTDYHFTQAWCTAQNISFTFTGMRTDVAHIYANGLNQASLTLSFDLGDSKGNAITEANSPTLEHVLSQISFIAYDTQQAIGSGDNSKWKVSEKANQYSKQFNIDGARLSSTAHTNIALRPDSKPPNGRLNYTFYVTCDSEQHENILIGFRIAPDGGNKSNPVVTSGPQTGGAHDSLDLQAAPKYTYLAADFKVAVQEVSEEDDDTTNNGGVSTAAYWRRWDYVVSIDGQRLIGNPKIFSCERPPDWASNQPCIRERRETLYGWQLYLWLEERPPAAGQKPQSADASFPGTRAVHLTAQEKEMLSFTIFTAFTGVVESKDTGALKSELQLHITDEYGNAGIVYANRNLPSKYADSTGEVMSKWKPLRDTPSPTSQGAVAPLPQPDPQIDLVSVYRLGTVNMIPQGTAAHYIVWGQSHGNNVGIGTPQGAINQFYLFAPDDPRKTYADERGYYFSNLAFPFSYLTHGAKVFGSTDRSNDADSVYVLQPAWDRWPAITIRSRKYLDYMRGGPEAGETVVDLGLDTKTDGFFWVLAAVEDGSPPWTS